MHLNFSKDNQIDHRSKAEELERQVISFSGLQLDKDIHIYNVPIKYDGDNYIHTVECGKDNKDTLILLHGFSGSLSYLYTLFKDLSQKFRLICIDFLGTGLSSRPEFKCKTPEETIAYFVDSIEEWRKEMKIEQFYLGGHSFGGYLAPMYAHKHPKLVKGLYLISPNGVSILSEDLISEEWKQSLGRVKTFFWMAYFKLYKALYKENRNPFELVRNHPYASRIVIKNYIEALFTENKDEGRVLGEFLYEMLNIEGGCEQALNNILGPPRLCAFIPLVEKVFPALRDMDVHCYFGEVDWNDWTGAHDFAKDPRNTKFKIEWIKDAGHQMTMQAPKQLTERILNTVGSG